eukprot:7043591-Prymnesium_polylepis.1
MARACLGSPLRNIAGQALALAPVAGGVPNTPYPYCVRCFACRRVACVSRGALGDMCRVACDRNGRLSSVRRSCVARKPTVVLRT